MKYTALLLLLATTLLSVYGSQNCVKTFKTRPNQAPPATCSAGHENNAGLCYPLCNQGYVGVGPVCWETCPEGWIDEGALCQPKIVSGDNGGCPWYDKCGLTFAKGCVKCPPGTWSQGCTCAAGSGPRAKSSYGRGVGTIPGCPDGWILVKSSLTNWGDACWPPCPSGFSDEQYFTCWQDCPSGTYGCDGTALCVTSNCDAVQVAGQSIRNNQALINQCSYANDPDQCKNLDVNRSNLNAALQQLAWPYCNATTLAIAKHH